MSIEKIIKRLEKNGHDVTKSMSTGNIIVKSAWGAANSFASYNAAYKWYFGKK